MAPGDSVALIAEQLSDSETQEGRDLYDELVWVHGAQRRDLSALQRMAEALVSGIDPTETTGPLWQLKVGCIRYCRTVREHHEIQQRGWLPSLREAEPSLEKAIERIEKEHRRIGGQLEEVEAAAHALTEREGDDARREVLDALNGLADDLGEHMAYEERALGPVLRRMRYL
jgi:hypothetical protein